MCSLYIFMPHFPYSEYIIANLISISGRPLQLIKSQILLLEAKEQRI